MIQQTSLESYLQLQAESKLNENQTIVYDVFKNQHPQALSIYDLAQILGWGEHKITGRLMELRKKGKIEYKEHKIQRATNRRVMTWGIKEAKE